MERGNAYTIFFAFIICLVSSSALTLVSKGLESKKNFNMEIERQRNVLKAFGYDCKGMKTAEIANTYKSNIAELVMKKDGSIVAGKKPADLNPETDKDLFPLFKNMQGKEVKGYAIPIVGYGLWSWCYGYFALGKDLNTVQGITFYKHGETPGLGGEIEAAWFQKNFVGKKIYDASGTLRSITLVKGKVADVITDKSQQIHYVDGISGATITCDGVTAFLKDGLVSYQSIFKNIK